MHCRLSIIALISYFVSHESKLSHILCVSVCEICQVCEHYLAHILDNLIPIVISYTPRIAGLPFGLLIDLQGTVQE